MSTLPMTDAEIAESYRQAKQQSKQIKILAQLCAASQQDIMAALERQGIKIQCKRGCGKLPTVDYIHVEALYWQGHNDYEIARQMGISVPTVSHWRSERRLPPHRKHTAAKTKNRA